MREGTGGQEGGRNTIIGGVIALAQVLQVAVVAEGVEEVNQLIELKEMGCNYAQGYLFARPMPAKEFELFMRQQQPASQAI